MQSFVLLVSGKRVTNARAGARVLRIAEGDYGIAGGFGRAGEGLDPGGYLLVTVHRAAATDTPEALDALVEVLESIDEPAVFPVHPRTRHRL